VLHVLARDYSKRWTLTDAAQIAGLEATYFSKLFHQTTGRTFLEWSSKVRVEEAKRFLRASDLSITAVAASVGYSDLTTFERAFRRVEHVSPAQYRARLTKSMGMTRIAESATRDAESNARNAEPD
jgi:two-component system, response regulator YesN